MDTDRTNRSDRPANRRRPDDTVIIKACFWAVAVAFLVAGFVLIVFGPDPLPRIMGFIVTCSAAASIGIMLAARAVRR